MTTPRFDDWHDHGTPEGEAEREWLRPLLEARGGAVVWAQTDRVGWIASVSTCKVEGDPPRVVEDETLPIGPPPPHVLAVLNG